VNVTVQPAHEGSVVCVPDIHGELTELPHGVWSTVPATPGVLTAIRSGALQVKKTKQVNKKATPPAARSVGRE
jgi:hypothetical protein